MSSKSEWAAHQISKSAQQKTGKTKGSPERSPEGLCCYNVQHFRRNVGNPVEEKLPFNRVVVIRFLQSLPGHGYAL